MAATPSVKRYTPASEIDETLDEYKGRTFITRRNNQVIAVTLDKTKARKVYLKYMGERKDGFSISRAEFLEYYELAP